MEECLKGQTKQANFLKYLIHETMLIRISLINWSVNVAYFKEKVARWYDIFESYLLFFFCYIIDLVYQSYHGQTCEVALIHKNV